MRLSRRYSLLMVLQLLVLMPGITSASQLSQSMRGDPNELMSPKPFRVDRQVTELPEFKLPYSPEADIRWTGGPHSFALGRQLEAVYPAGAGSGLDFAGTERGSVNFEIRAIAPGTVVKTSPDRCNDRTGLGCWVAVRHDVGGSVAVYGHMQFGSIRVQLNEHVDQAAPIGNAGNTGMKPDDPVHLHLELRHGNDTCDLPEETVPWEQLACSLWGYPFGWDDGLPFIDDYKIFGHLVDSEGLEAYNYDGSAVREVPGESVDVNYEFPYRDSYYDGATKTLKHIERRAIVRVSVGYRCNSSVDCEDNVQMPKRVQFAGGGRFFYEHSQFRGFDLTQSDSVEPSELGGRLISTNVRDEQGPDDAASDTVLVIDTSGSMSELDRTGKVKIEAARSAARRLSRMIGNEGSAGQGSDRLAVVTFGDTANVRQVLSTDQAAIAESIDELDADGYTAMAAGLDTAIDLLEKRSLNTRGILVLLSDGLPNRTRDGSEVDGRDEIRQALIPRLGTAVDCTYVIGFGDPAGNPTFFDIFSQDQSIDEVFLTEISSSTDCGGYFPATSATELAATFIRSRHLAKGGVLRTDASSETIQQGETSNAFPMLVPAGTEELNVTLDWPGSYLDLQLTDPRGKRVQPGYPGAQFYLDLPPAQIIVANPRAGRWQAAAFGADVPEGVTDFSMIASTQASSSPAPLRLRFGLVALLMMLGFGALGVALVTAVYLSRGNAHRVLHRLEQPWRRLVVNEPGHAPRAVYLDRSPFVIGRSPECDLVLDDPTVSRHHCSFRTSGPRVFLEDLNSTGGTRMGGRAVQPVAEMAFDEEIQLGQTRIRFF